MARTPDGRQLTEAHKQAQIRLGALAAALTLNNAARLDADNLDATEARWRAGQLAIITTLRRRSQALAEQYLRDYWAAEGMEPTEIPEVDLTPARDALDWVVPTIKARTARYGRTTRR